jgi:hypothetical protein
MRNVLFSLGHWALLLEKWGFAEIPGTNGFHATANRQMRLEFVRDRLPVRRTLIAARQNHAVEVEWGRDCASSSAFSRRCNR